MISVDRRGVRAGYIWESPCKAVHAARRADAAVEKRRRLRRGIGSAVSDSDLCRDCIGPVYRACNSSPPACCSCYDAARMPLAE